MTPGTDTPMVLFSSTRGDGVDSSHSQEVMLLISIAAGICSLVTVIGNIVVIMSFCINKSLRNFSNYLILSLALSDLTIGVFSMNVFTTYNVHQEWILGSAMCKAWLSVDYTASNASVMNLLVICVDRYLAITKPVKYKGWCTPTRAAIAIFFVWVLSFLMWVPAITLWDVTSVNSTMSSKDCYIPFINESPVLSVVTIVGAFYFPASLMVLMYWRVILQIKRRKCGIRSIIQDASKPGAPQQKQKRGFLKKLKRKAFVEDDAKASSSGSNSSTLNPGCPSVNPSLQEPEGKKNAVLELSDVSSGLSSAKSRLCNSEDVNIEQSRSNINGASYQPTKPVYFQKAFYNRDYPGARLTPPPYEMHRRLAKSHVSSDQNKTLLLKKKVTTTSTMRDYRSNREHRVTVLLKFILLCFILLWLPYSLSVIIEAACKDCVPPVVWNLSYWLCYLNSTVNPFCYGLCNENFRRTFKAILTTRWWTKESRKMLRVSRRTLASNGQLVKKNPNFKTTPGRK